MYVQENHPVKKNHFRERQCISLSAENGDFNTIEGLSTHCCYTRQHLLVNKMMLFFSECCDTCRW